MVKMENSNHYNNNFAVAQEQSGRAKLDIKLPTGFKFKYFSKTQNGTEFQAELVNLYGNKNAVQCEVRTEKTKLQTNENFVTQGHTTCIDKNIQDEFYHFVDQDEGSLQTLFYEGEEAKLRSQSTKELYIYGEACLLTTLKFENWNVMRRKKTCTLFALKGEMNSASAYLQRVGEIEDLSNDSNVIAFTETERYLYIEILHSDSKEVVYLLAKELQNYSNVTQISRLKNLLRYLETKTQALRNQSQCSNINHRGSGSHNEKSSIKRLNEMNKISQNKFFDAHQERYYSNSKFHIKDNIDTTFSHIERQQSVEKSKMLITLLPTMNDATITD
ncbi:unnamed protein product [Mytilus edulis]|uniref:Uncharacterized protein n=1 Tax=Mytilus edulis TaxID=6550 RepID=A0A8S3QUV5_MYTED|nr:unnamed protein product [Mytilus edulis]